MTFHWTNSADWRWKDEGDRLYGLPSIGDLVHLLRPGDEILWGDRKQPLAVVEEDRRARKELEEGAFDAYWTVEGPQGGEYAVFNWWHWGEGEPFDESTELNPQSRRTTHGWEDTRHFPQFKIEEFEGSRIKVPSNTVDPTDIRRIKEKVEQAPGSVDVVYRPNDLDRRVYGQIDRIEFGDPVISPEGVWPWFVAEHTIHWGDIVAIRAGGEP